MSLAGFPFQQLNQRALSSPEPLNLATDLGVSIFPAKAVSAWRCILAYHLTPEENNGRQNVFVECLDEHGKRTQAPTLRWTRAGIDSAVESKRMDKPDNEPAADIPMAKWDTITCWIDDGATPFDTVGWMHTRHNGNGDGNRWGHNSYYVVFKRQAGAMPEPPPVDPPSPTEPEPLTLESLAQRVAVLEVDYQLLWKQLIDSGVQIDLLRHWQQRMEGD